MSNSDSFKKMAERIEHNAGSKFGGAAVVIPPQNGGDPVELLILDEKGDPAQFWGTLLTRAQMEVSKIEERNRIAQGFGMGR